MSQNEVQIESVERDLEILDRYQAFSAEVLRVALLGIAAIGFLITNASAKEDQAKATIVSLRNPGTKIFLCLALVALGCSVAFSLLHRFISTESIAYHTGMLRVVKKATADEDRIIKERLGRDKNFKRSTATIYIAAGALMFGAIALAVGFILAITLS